jgi:hypothetical protein
MDKLMQTVLDEVKRLSQAGQKFGYEHFEELVELRQILTDKITNKGNLSLEEKQIISEILSYDNLILKAMQNLKSEAEDGLARIRSSKKQRSAYVQMDAYDSIILDTKK